MGVVTWKQFILLVVLGEFLLVKVYLGEEMLLRLPLEVEIEEGVEKGGGGRGGSTTGRGLGEHHWGGGNGQCELGQVSLPSKS